MGYTTLVIGPGGNKGFAYLGQLVYLESKGHLKDIKNYAGVSVGSVITLLMCCGYSLWEIVDEAGRVDLVNFGSMNGIGDMIKTFSLFNRQHLEVLLEKVIKKKLNMVPTLQQLYEMTGKEYMAVSTCVEDVNTYPVYINRHRFPNMRCDQAAIMSSCIPVIFQYYSYEGKEYIDGGLSNPFPIDQYFDENNGIIGLSLNSRSSANPLTRFFSIMMNQLRIRITDSIPTPMKSKFLHIHAVVDVNATDGLLVNRSEKEQLFHQGHQQTKALFEKAAQPNTIIYDS